MNLVTETYSMQSKKWPAFGRHILAQYDTNGIVVYQAFNPAISSFAANHGYFGGPFSLNRMSWIKPNFLWMMYRCGWATKPDQQSVLAVRIKRSGFDDILSAAVPSAFDAKRYRDNDQWKTDLANSDVRLQWDPDHDPSGAPTARRAMQLGLRGDVLARYAREWIISIEDISSFVDEQRTLLANGRSAGLMTPAERIYLVSNIEVAGRLKVDGE